MASEVTRAIEAIVMVAEEPVPPHLLAQILEVAPGRVEELCAEVAESYLAEDRGFELVRVAGGYRFQSHPDLAGYVERFALEGQSSRLSAAALETLALVAYKQPVSRAQVSEVRGVSVDGVMRTLQHRGYVAEVGRDPGPGQAVLYGTTVRFLEKLGMDSLDQLPPLAQFVPGPEVMEALDAGLRHGGGKTPPEAAPVDVEAIELDAGYDEPGADEVGPGDVGTTDVAATDVAATDVGYEGPAAEELDAFDDVFDEPQPLTEEEAGGREPDGREPDGRDLDGRELDELGRGPDVPAAPTGAETRDPER